MTACGQCQGSECSNAMENYDSSNDDDNDDDDGVDSSEEDDYGNIFKQLLNFFIKFHGNFTEC